MNQLRVRTEYTFGETFAPISRLVKRLQAIGAQGAGIVDTGTWGHVAWDKACRAASIQPLFGVQLCVVPDLAFEDRPSMWFLAMSSEGLQALYRASSLAHRQASRGQPRLTYEDVLAIGPGVAKFAGGVLNEEFLLASKAGIDFDPASELLNRKKLLLLKKHKALQPVIISDNAYAATSDKAAFEMIGRGAKMTPQHLLTFAEMKLALPALDFDKAVQTGEEIVRLASGVQLPKAPTIRAEGSLEELCRAGITERKLIAKGVWNAAYEERLNCELEMIRSKDFESYFLIVADMVRWSKLHMLVGPSRGSAAGSLVCYLTRITEIDPIPPKLIFERFIDVTRNDLPDIDLDFVDSKRQLVIQYLRDKWGAANIAHIGSVSTFKPKSALIAVAKKLGVPPFETAAVKDSIFERSSGDSRANFALLDTLEQTEPGRKLLEKYPAMALAAEIEAHASHSGVHAAGILVCNEPIENFCTVTADGVAQVEAGVHKNVETLNLLKIDVLGLRTLGVLEDSGIKKDWYDMTFDDPAVFKVLNDKRFAGIFQFEGGALQSVASQMEINNLDDIGHVTALARPGPMASGGTTQYLLRRAGKEKFRTPHPAMDKYVMDTFGIVVYQEQVLRICREIGKLEWADTSSVRKAMSQRKGVEFFDQFWQVFKKGAAEEGVPEAAAKEIWSQINTMGCLSGRTQLQNPFQNHATPKSISISKLAANNGCIRPRAKFKTGPRKDSKAERFDIIKRQQLYALNPKTDTMAPVRCVGAIASGTRWTFCLTADDRKIYATGNHQFFTRRGWLPLAMIQPGKDEVAMLGATAPTERKRKKGTGSGGHNWWPKAQAGGALFATNVRKLKRLFKLCQSCHSAPYQETHHLDGNHERHDWDNLLPVCRSCHRRLHGASVPHSRGKQIKWALVNSITVGRKEKVYDVCMPLDVQNFVANDFVVHNSWAFNLAHSYSYAVVSYWTAWLKAHHPLEFSAATLRNAKDDESAIKLLREITQEGVPYVSFDPELSEVNWSAKGDKLVGGFMGLKGIGEAKARKLLEERAANGGRLSDSQRSKLLVTEQTFSDIFPTQRRFGEYYTNPEKFGIRHGTCVAKIDDIKGEAEFVYIGRLIGKDLRDHNELIRVKRRDGKVKKGPTLFLDLDIEDDTGAVLTRIERYDFEDYGRKIWEEAQVGSWWLVRAERKLWGRPDGGFRMTYVKKIRQLPDPFSNQERK